MKHTILITASFLALSLALASCASEEPLVNPDRDVLRSYEFTMFDSQDELNFSLIDINQPISRIESPFNWLDIAQGEYDEMGFTRVNITRTSPTPEGFDSDDAYLYLEDNNTVKVSITSEGLLMPPDSNDEEYKKFNEEWWNEYTIKYTPNSNTPAEYIPLPWNIEEATQSTIPVALCSRQAISRNAGWRMAYNLFTATATAPDGSRVPNGKPYFALYNKYTGALRVFYYQPTNPGTGGELTFSVTPDYKTTPKNPYYHTLQYAIPVSNTGIPQKTDIPSIGDSNSPFQQLYAPYYASKILTLNKGWYCFDIDMSCYNPNVKSPFSAGDCITLTPHTTDNSSITLAGAIEGTSNGIIDMHDQSNTAASSSKGVSFIDVAKGQASNVKEIISSVKNKNYLKAVYKGAMTLFNIGKAIFSEDNNSETVTKYEPPTVELTHNGQLSLTGYSVSQTSNNAIPVRFSYSAFTVDEKENIGEGVWSLKSNPVVYVVSDRLCGDKQLLDVMVDQKGYLTGPYDPADYYLRLATFLDPSSLEVNINTKAFPNIRNIQLSYTYGVYPNQPHGHTNLYRRDLLGLTVDEPTFINKDENIGRFYVSNSSTFANMTYDGFHPLDKLPVTKVDASYTPSVYNQNGAKYRYYGCPGNSLPSSDKDFFIVDPVVLLPTNWIKKNDKDEYGEGMFFDFVAPDFVVGVMLSFDYTGSDGTTSRAVFSKKFVPTIKSITAKEAKALTFQLENIERIWDDNNPPVRIANGRSMIERTLSTIFYLPTDYDPDDDPDDDYPDDDYPDDDYPDDGDLYQ